MILRRIKRNLRDESYLKFLAKSRLVSSDVALKDHDYIFPCKGTGKRGHVAAETLLLMTFPCARKLGTFFADTKCF